MNGAADLARGVRENDPNVWGANAIFNLGGQ